MDDGVGGKLRDARIRRKLSLQEVEAATKIRLRYLQAIENEDWDQLPGDTYARAFIRTYSALLGLDGERLAEDQRRLRGAARPGEKLPRVDSRPRSVAPRRSRRRVPPQLVTALVLVLVAAALVAIGLAGGDDPEPPSGRPGGGANAAGAKQEDARQPAESAGQRGHTLKLVATSEVWVCLLDGRGNPLVEGSILNAGEAEGPFRSGSFTLALGNGAVAMTVDGQQANPTDTPSPIGFAIGPRGSLRELPASERPTCT